MDLLKCAAYLRAVDAGSLSAAAEQMGYTPSGLTRMVNALEDELGFPLLSRNRRGVAPTEDGRRMLPIFRELVRWNETAAQQAAEIRGLAVGELRVGAYYSVAACWLPEILSAFQSDYPHIRIQTMEGGNRDLLEWFGQRRVDCCILGQRPIDGDWIPLKEDPLVVWLPWDHPLAALPAVPLEALNGVPFINILPGRDTDLERLLKRHRLTPDIRYSAADSFATYEMVAAGLGLSVNNALMSRRWPPDVAVRPFDPPQSITLGIAVPSLAHASPATKKFVEYVKRLLLSPEPA